MVNSEARLSIWSPNFHVDFAPLLSGVGNSSQLGRYVKKIKGSLRSHQGLLCQEINDDRKQSHLQTCSGQFGNYRLLSNIDSKLRHPLGEMGALWLTGLPWGCCNTLSFQQRLRPLGSDFEKAAVLLGLWSEPENERHYRHLNFQYPRKIWLGPD